MGIVGDSRRRMGKLKPGQMSNAHLSGLIRQVLLCDRWCGEEEGLLEKASCDPHFAEISGRNTEDWVVGKWNEYEKQGKSWCYIDKWQVRVRCRFTK